MDTNYHEFTEGKAAAKREFDHGWTQIDTDSNAKTQRRKPELNELHGYMRKEDLGGLRRF